ncbi:MAG: polyribonucleotide nucleotidyltransferase [Holosporaceae bacterium]|jgi:polyribonucleotide nucleotidyltransferase|nr:polyribonucleotide nucleotidyltransferase [Holosporaceae bacterium]
MIFEEKIMWGGRLLSIEAGRLAHQATGAVTVRYGDTIVLCTVVADRKVSEEMDFFPLTVNYIEKAYSAGKIPGGFVKREGRPSERETLISRLIDRPIRPLFHEDFRNETHVICTVLSFDGENDTDVISIIGASAALTISGIPFLGPIAAAKIGYENGKPILNPKVGHESDLDLVVAGSRDGILMVESCARELQEDKMLAALKFGHDSFQSVIDMITRLAENCANDPWEVPSSKSKLSEIASRISEKFLDEIEDAYARISKVERNIALAKTLSKILKHFADDVLVTEKVVQEAFEDVCSQFIRSRILSYGKRIGGRNPKDIRKISVDVSMLPRAHGSALFQRGETQTIVVATLGTAQDEQLVDSLAGEYRERFMLHYNFPPFSVGEVGRLGSTGRREIGHGKLAWRAIVPVLPSKDKFPYTLRVVSEVLACNGSSSMATVCGSSLALMDAGVPLKNAVAGIAMGLVIEDEKCEILSDISGEEDHIGDMDLKVAGTCNGITALQMDIKVTRVTFEIMEKALQQAKVGRLHILDEMSSGLKTHRTELNENAPKISHIIIPKDKIREVIGSGGKVIRDIIERTGAKIDIDDSGNVMVSAPNTTAVDEAINIIKGIAMDPVCGAVYIGKVVKIMDFGAFVNFFGSKEGLVHISEMSEKNVGKVTDIMKEGDELKVKFLGCDSRGRAKLTMKFVQEHAS